MEDYEVCTSVSSKPRHICRLEVPTNMKMKILCPCLHFMKMKILKYFSLQKPFDFRYIF